MTFLLKTLKFFFGIGLIIVCISVSQTLWVLITSIHPQSATLIPPPAAALLIGLSLWLVLYFTAPRPVRTYILAHELTHALWGALMGAEIYKISVDNDRGFVELSKNNFIITLAPYFFPLYTFIIIVAYFICGIFFDVEKYNLFWLAAIGFTWGFHLTFTIAALTCHQTDIRQQGHLFSYTVIYLFNVVGICFWVIMVSPATLETMINQLRDNTVRTALRTRDYAEYGLEKLNRLKQKAGSHPQE